MLRYIGNYFTRQQESTGAVNGYIEEMFGGLKVIKVFCHEQQARNGCGSSMRSSTPTPCAPMALPEL